MYSKLRPFLNLGINFKIKLGLTQKTLSAVIFFKDWQVKEFFVKAKDHWLKDISTKFKSQ